jgi:hypothetical protein
LCFLKGQPATGTFFGISGPGSVEPGADDFEGPAVDFVLVDGSQSQRSLGAGDRSGHMDIDGEGTGETSAFMINDD